MSTTKTETPKPADKPGDKPPENRPDSFRETIESIVIAFVLAFLFRSFEAEAFVIPTGSMAPTLTGLHKDLNCSKCGHEFFVGASEEVDTETGGAPRYAEMRETNPRTGRDQMVVCKECPQQIATATCPVCGFTTEIGPTNPQDKPYYSYTGDRILVSKFAYQFNEPDRWDVVVFKYPESAQKNYIKRLIGKPEETIKIYQGDIYIRDSKSKDGAFHIAAKPPRKVRAMMQLVYDNDLALAYLPALGWHPRWSPGSDDPFELSDAPPMSGGWQPQADGHDFATRGPAKQLAWLRYRHFFPSYQDWNVLDATQSLAETKPGARIPVDYPVKPHLIADFTAYNSGEESLYNYQQAADAAKKNLPPPRTAPSYPGGKHWVGDLMVDCQLEVKPGAEKGEARLELIRAGESFESRFDLDTGAVTLVREGTTIASSKAKTSVQGSGSWELSFANVDRHLTLWVDGAAVEFVRPDGSAFGLQVPYEVPEEAVPTVRDLSPVGVAVSGAEATVKHLKVWRDIYYISASKHNRDMVDFVHLPNYLLDYSDRNSGQRWSEFHSDPQAWPGAYRVLRESPEFKLEVDQFLVLGDNSAKSADSRLWSSGPVVPRDLMIGKALFIFWPHAWETPWNFEVEMGGFGSIRVPFYPNFKRMTLIR